MRRAHLANLAAQQAPPETFPEVHLREPDDRLRNMHKNAIANWRAMPVRVLLEPFGQDHITDTRACLTHDNLDRNLKSVTGLDTIHIFPPTKTPKDIFKWEAPTAWMSHSWPQHVADMLIKQRVWIFNNISFVAVADVSKPPRFLVPLIGLTRWDENEIRNMVVGEFTKDPAYSKIKKLVSENPDYADAESEDHATCDLIDTVEIVVRDVVTKSMTTKAAYLYMDPPTRSAKKWVEWRDGLSLNPFSGETVRATVSRRKTRCEMCHGVDHQTDQCQFPQLDGWKAELAPKGPLKGLIARDADSDDETNDAKPRDTGRGNPKPKPAQFKPQAGRR